MCNMPCSFKTFKLIIASLIVSIATFFFLLFVLEGYTHKYYRDTDAILVKAKLLSDPSLVAEHLTFIRKSMSKLKVDTGHTAVYYQDASNDLAAKAESFELLAKEFNSVSEMDRRSLEYGKALENARGALDKFTPDLARNICWRDYFYLEIVQVIAFFSMIILAIVVIFVLCIMCLELSHSEHASDDLRNWIAASKPIKIRKVA